MPSHQKSRSESATNSAAGSGRKTVRSMTGYAHRSEDTSLGLATVELRSVNSRFTDLQFRLSDDLRPLEPQLRRHISQVVSRGKIECRLQLRGREGDTGGIQVNEALIKGLAEADASVRGLAPHAVPMSAADYLRWPGAIGGGPISKDLGADETTGAPARDASLDRLWTPLAPIVEQALADFVASREREGAQHAATIGAQIAEMQTVVEGLKPMIPELLAAAQKRLAARLEEAMPQAGNGIPVEETFARIRQEVALLGLRSDVTEEFDRLAIHFTEVLRALANGGALGKRLDFLTQELNREANTIASKASGIAITDGAVALKLLIEQMREQVQNIE